MSSGYYLLTIKPLTFYSGKWDSDTIMTAALAIAFYREEEKIINSFLMGKPLFVVSNGFPKDAVRDLVFHKGPDTVFCKEQIYCKSIRFILYTEDLQKTNEYLEILSYMGIGSRRTVGGGWFSISSIDPLKPAISKKAAIISNYVPNECDPIPLNSFTLDVKQPKTAEGKEKQTFVYIKPNILIETKEEYKQVYGRVLKLGDKYQVCYGLAYPIKDERSFNNEIEAVIGI